MFFKKTLKILILFFIIAAAFTLWIFFGGENRKMETENPDSSLSIFKREKSDKTSSVSNSVSTASADSARINKYENSQYGFSFNYPTNFAVNEFPEDESKTVLIIKNIQTGQTIQIYITAYDDPDFVINAERVKKDIPDLPFSNSADVIVGGKAKGVAFFSVNEAFGGETAEVWFADGENLYQATARAKDAKLLEEIIKSWRF